MKYALFTAIPFVGHLNPLIQQATELQRRGWRVAIAATSEMRSHINREAPLVPFLDLGPLGDDVVAAMRQVEREATEDPSYYRGARRFLPLLGQLWPVMFDGLVAAINRDRPTLLVVDLFTWAGFAAAEATSMPIAVNNPSLLTGVPLEILPPAPDVPFLLTTQSIHAVPRWQRLLHPLLRRVLIAAVWLTVGRQLNALWRSRGLKRARIPDTMRKSPILVNGAFGLEYRRPLPENVTMVGPMMPDTFAPLPPELDAWLSNGPPVIYINLGTVVSASRAMLAKIAAGTTKTGTRVLWVLKPAQAAQLPSPLPGVRIVDWLPSTQAVLRHPNVRVFVSHCGINSVHESIACGTPIVGIPMFADQRDMAQRVADAGVGLYFDKSTLTASQLREAILRVLTDASFRDSIPALQRAFAEAGGVRRAADVIEQAA